jgi:hypothetical protein
LTRSRRSERRRGGILQGHHPVNPGEARGGKNFPLRPGAESAHQKDDEADQKNQAEPSSTDGRPSKVKTAAAEQKNKDDNK